MDTITTVLTADHRRGDELFDSAVRAIEADDWATCRLQYDAFVQALRRHMQIEEEILFPAFEQASGITRGPTWVMRQEHQQMLGLLEEIAGKIEDHNADDFRTLAQAFTQLMSEHSAKEERVLYPMCDQVLPDFDSQKLVV